MKKEYTKIASIPKDEKIVAMTSYGGYWYWSWKYPFRHYKDFRYLVATERAVYEITKWIVEKGNSERNYYDNNEWE